MRVLMISRCPPWPLYFGDRLIVYHLARALAAQGVALTLLALADRYEDWSAQQQAQYAPLFDEVHLFAPRPRRAHRLLWRALVPGARFPATARQAWQPDLFAAAQQHAASGRYDVAHVFGGVQVYEVARALGALSALVTPYESYSLYLRTAAQAADGPSRVVRRLQQRLAAHYEAFMFRPYQRVTVLAAPDQAALAALDPSARVDVIPNGIDLAAFGPPPDAAARTPGTLLFVGNFAYAPNVDAALTLLRTIWPRVRARVPNAQLWLVGNAPPPSLRAAAGEGVTLTGRVPDVLPYLQRASVFVAPLRVGAGLKNKVLEALAAGCPVVATPLAADGIAVEDGVHALLAATPDALAEAVLRALESADLRQGLGGAGHALAAERYSWAGVAAQYAALYQVVAAAKGR